MSMFNRLIIVNNMRYNQEKQHVNVIEFARGNYTKRVTMQNLFRLSSVLHVIRLETYFSNLLKDKQPIM